MYSAVDLLWATSWAGTGAENSIRFVASGAWQSHSLFQRLKL